MTDPAWAREPGALLGEVWRRLEAGEGAARQPALATVGEDGPSVRTVVLRGADRARASLEMHADVASAKVRHLRRTPEASVHVWDAEASLQVRLAVRVRVVEGAAAADAWARVPEGARCRYGGTEPGARLASPLDRLEAAEAMRFAVLAARVHRIDALHLGQTHRRALYLAADGFAGAWIAP
jgi:pyridoxine/pyridoxamine 5'-phosphate oxidase